MNGEQVYKVDPKLAAALIDARSIEEARASIAALEKALKSPVWRAVGDLEANDGPIELGKDAPAQLVERVVNGIEACFELKAKLTRGVEPQSPHRAAETWFHVPKGGIAAMDATDVRKLAVESVHVHLADSGDEGRPTAVIEDYGIGQHPADFPATLLSLHRSNKRDKPYLIGRYGQGGATALAHSEYTIIVSRRAPIPGEEPQDVVGFTVVQYRPAKLKGGTYEYLCGPGRAILAISAEFAPPRFRRTHGTRVTHVAYDLHKYNAAYRQQKTGLWALLNSALPRPPLPIHITGDRRKDLHGDKNAPTTGRIITGMAAVLSGLPRAPTTSDSESGDDDDVNVEPSAPRRRGKTFLRYDDEQELDVANGRSLGKIRIRVWLLGGTDSTETYVRADQAISLTISGQRHGQRSREFLKDCKLGFLSKRMLVEVEADRLSAEARRALFPSGREEQRDNEYSDLVFGTLADYLENDDLKALEEEAKREELAKASSKVKESIRRKVAQLIKHHIGGGGGARGGQDGGVAPTPSAGSKAGRTPRGRVVPPPSPPPADDTLMLPIPTTLEIPNSQHRVYAGKTGHILLELNAKNGYLAEHGDDLRVEIDGPQPGGLRHKGTGSLRGGRARLVFGSDPNAAVGDYVVRASLVVPGGHTLAGIATVTIEPGPAVAGGQDFDERGLPDINWYKNPRYAPSPEERSRLQSQWPGDWTGGEVGDVEASGGSLVFRLNEDFPDLRNAIMRRAGSERGTSTAIQSLKDRYAGALSFGMWLLERQRNEVPEAERPPESWLAKEYGVLAKVQLAMIEPDLDVDEPAQDAA